MEYSPKLALKIVVNQAGYLHLPSKKYTIIQNEKTPLFRDITKPNRSHKRLRPLLVDTTLLLLLDRKGTAYQPGDGEMH